MPGHLEPDLELARRFLAAHPPPGRVRCCAVTGSHLYGFPSPDSDLDLKGIHQVPTGALLGLRPDVGHHDVTAVHDGVECDLTTNELAGALGLLLAGNGNMLERICSRYQVVTDADHEALAALAQGAISRRFARHYTGFFAGCRREHERAPTAKSMLYSYRVALTGTHLLATGEVEPDLRVLAPAHGYDDVAELIERKQAGEEHGGLDPGLDDHHRRRWPQLAEALERAERASTLPDEAVNIAEVEAWLVGLRLADV